MRLPRRARYALVGLGIVAAWVLAGWMHDARAARDIGYALVTAAESAFGDAGERLAVAFLVRSFEVGLMALLAATLAAPIAMMVRAHARTRLRATGNDALEPLRRRLEARSWRVRVATWAPAAAAVALTMLDPMTDMWSFGARALALAATLPAAFALTALVRRSLARFASPPARAEDLVGRTAGDDELFFSAVAVTREARGLVAAFALANVAVVAAVLTQPVSMLHVSVYALFAAAAAVGFRRASRIAVGLDGVLVTGTSRQRFFAYRDLDALEVGASGDVIAKARGREVLRLQLVGDDAPRIAAILDRIRAGIDRAKAQAGDAAQRFVETASAAALSHAAHGHAHYRGRAASREDLIALVESPATAEGARRAAAEALGRAADAGERERLRIAAGLCAEPAARAALAQVAAGEEADEEAAAADLPPARRVSALR